MKKQNKKFIVIAGPCVIESKRIALDTALRLKDIASKNCFNFFFKASFDKANRTSIKSFRGPGLVKGIKILEEVKKRAAVSLISDVHTPEQVAYVKDVLDVIQIPAFLCRQTDLVIEAAKTKKTINIIKGQFVAPSDIKYVVEKARAAGNRNIFITERGTCFGYNDLVVDFRSFLIMKKLGHPVIFDVTHSLQRPSAKGGVSGGSSEFVQPLALAAVSCGVDGIFIEVHAEPKKALSDKYTSLLLSEVDKLFKNIATVRKALYEKN